MSPSLVCSPLAVSASSAASERILSDIGESLEAIRRVTECEAKTSISALEIPPSIANCVSQDHGALEFPWTSVDFPIPI